MTSLFLEYQSRLKIKDDLIGKLFYWYKTTEGKEYKFYPHNVFKVVDVRVVNSNTQLVHYEYVFNGNVKGSEELTNVLKCSKPYIGSQFSDCPT